MKTFKNSVLLLVALIVVLPVAIFAYTHGAPNSSQVSPEDMGEGVLPRSLQMEDTAAVMVQLTDAPVGVIYAELAGVSQARAAEVTQAQLATIESAQAAVREAVKAVDTAAVHLYSVQRAYNGVAMLVDRNKAGTIASLPGVAAVVELTAHELDHTTSMPLLGAPEVWQGAGYDLTGEGIRIGIIDTGIDYHHTHFGGSGEGYELNDTTTLDDGFEAYFGPDAVKVVGGYDFVGDNYNANGVGSALVPRPDEDPLDCNGHGSHVAGTAAGFGVNTDGSTYTGGYDEVPFSDLRIGPGMAPEADLYALRVFGCNGSSTVIPQAIDWALDPNGDGILDDHLDVINMSLGSNYGSPADPSSVASEIASIVGVVVVTSAGNGGDSYYIIGSPAAAGRTIAVAGSADASSVLDGFEINGGAAAGVYPASAGTAFNFSSFDELTGTLTYPASQPSGCLPFDADNRAMIAGTIVLLNWTDNDCSSSARGNNLENAGAIGVLIADNSLVFDLNIFGSERMPSYSIPLEIGEVLSDTLAAEETVNIRLTNEYDGTYVYSTPQYNDLVYPATSRGPRNPDSYLKPDLAAIGVTVFSAATDTGDEGTALNGTSMAAPHVAGLMALLIEQHPDWTTEELKALAMNTATYDIFNAADRSGLRYGPGRIGAGRISAPNSANSQVIAYNADDEGVVSVSFGPVDVLTDTMTMVTKTIEVLNKGVEPAVYTVLFEPRVESAGVSFALSESTIAVDPGQSVMIDVTVMADGALMGRGGADGTINPMPTDEPRHYLPEAAGYVMLIPNVGYFTAELSGANEVPPNTSTITATATLTYTLQGTFDYRIEFSDEITVNTAGVHIHEAPATANGNISVNIIASGDGPATFGPGNPLTGTTTDALTDIDQIQQLFTRGMYLNIHTDDYPSGEIRGQLMAENTHLRVAVHSVPRVISDMAVEPLMMTPSVTGTNRITLTGVPIATADLTSLVSAFELQVVDGQDSGAPGFGDIQYVGTHSTYPATGTFTDTVIYFGISKYGDGTTPVVYGYNQVWIDTDENGLYDFVAIVNDVGEDTFTVGLFNLNITGFEPELTFLNVVSATVDTNVYNNSVMVMGIPAASLSLSTNNSDFNYFVNTFDPFLMSDQTPVVSYDVMNPAIRFSGGVMGPVYVDEPGEIAFEYDVNAAVSNGTKGVLLLHHHNGSGERADVVMFPKINDMYLPLVAKEAPLSIAQIVVADARFRTLVTGLRAADLLETLDGSGSFTVFAPTNDAFEKLPREVLLALLADKDALTSTLLYHMVDGEIPADAIETLNALATLQGSDIVITVGADGHVYLNGHVRMTITDIQAHNGIIHVVDTVLMPPSP